MTMRTIGGTITASRVVFILDLKILISALTLQGLSGFTQITTVCSVSHFVNRY